MNKNIIIMVWSWLVLATILEVLASSFLSSATWALRDGLITAILATAVVPLVLAYLDLIGEHRSVKLFVLVGVFFSLDLVLIWTASLVH